MLNNNLNNNEIFQSQRIICFEIIYNFIKTIIYEKSWITFLTQNKKCYQHKKTIKLNFRCFKIKISVNILFKEIFKWIVLKTNLALVTKIHV